jgi:hypothetical protein
MPRLVAILGGGDWADASVEHLVVPDNMNVEAERTLYIHAPKAPYCRWETFAEWLKKRGGREANECDIEVVLD